MSNVLHALKRTLALPKQCGLANSMSWHAGKILIGFLKLHARRHVHDDDEVNIDGGGARHGMGHACYLLYSDDDYLD